MSEIDAYDYVLPPERIAQEPLADRSAARLLVIDRDAKTLAHWHVRDLPQFLKAGDAVVLNDTRVVPARLAGRRTKTGGAWEGLFLSLTEDGAWQILSQTRGKLQAGESVTLVTPAGSDGPQLALIEKRAGGAWLARPAISAADAEFAAIADVEAQTLAILNACGSVPIPPYIRGGESTPDDRQRYQTVYAARPGAVAAPTAGLHFTPELLAEIAARGVDVIRLTLHVGLGTFRPIATETLDAHDMHSEWGELSAAAAARLSAIKHAGGRIVAIGTTSVRVLETAAATGALTPWSGWTNLFIRPPYAFRAVDALLTNFHLPKSTLLVLVRTFGGDALIRQAYEAAIAEAYRFYSYGDAMLIL